MSRVTDRYMCLGCGRYWRTDFHIEPIVHFCPYCKDMYWIDNIKLDIPPLLGEEHHFEFMCDHKLSTDIPGDLKWCWCGQRISEPIGDDPAETQLHWQQERVNRLLEEVV